MENQYCQYCLRTLFYNRPEMSCHIAHAICKSGVIVTTELDLRICEQA